MSELWAPLSTRFFRDPRVRAAGRDAALLFVAGLGYCTEHLTDGFIPGDAVAVLAAESWSKPSSAKKLVEHGLWRAVEGGWQVAGWTSWNRTREEIEEKRAGARLRQQRSRARRTDVTASVTRDVTPPVTRDSHDIPTPTPVTPPPTPPAGGEDPRIDAAYTIALNGERGRRRADRARDLERHRATLARWCDQWPGIAVDQLAEGLRNNGVPPRSVANLARRPRLEAVQ